MATTTSLYEQYVLGNYGPPSCTLVRGEGVHVYDDSNRRLLDFGSGIAVTAIGHCHPHWVDALQKQTAQLGHISNLYAHESQGRLAEKLVKIAGPGRAFFCNSGAEANEALLKLARLHGRKLSDGQEGVRYKVITAENAFHGRTFGGMAATPQEKIQGGFRPMLEGFSHGKLNDLNSFASKIDAQTAAIMVETIQGEGGINSCTSEFLQGLRKLCDEHNLLLLIDEVQCGIGRTGQFFAYEESGIKPDAIGMAKGLAGGFPIGAVWIAEEHAGLFTPGSHGTTFGGGPLACTAALATLDVIEHEDLLSNVQQNSAPWIARLQTLIRSYPNLVDEVRGRGYMVGLVLKTDPRPIVTLLRDAGLVTIPAGGNVIRLLPPLIATEEDLQTATDILFKVLSGI
ncbi:aspartate aminotransferase family protein [Cerasicoccus arenae]|uniref:Acetylornithine aminotransferase n=1 Tax=Cerasicoccus arenae TaxID=424488 RepID=A0A8J3GCP6_9BACT|nr:aspartate aminotransferase family protein [Cerasicoccus arenae]MBK1856963.1 aspartate aminotransferase family protein [Cerasicoccus arenae]GHB90086.1 acetylornithine aminotransferase [Cerasicoccus arenae]